MRSGARWRSVRRAGVHDIDLVVAEGGIAVTVGREGDLGGVGSSAQLSRASLRGPSTDFAADVHVHLIDVGAMSLNQLSNASVLLCCAYSSGSS